MYGSTVYCVTTAEAVAEGRYPAGTKVAILAAYIADVVGSDVYIGYVPYCPPGYACGEALGMLLVDSGALTPPQPETFPNLYGTATGAAASTSGAARIIADAWAY